MARERLEKHQTRMKFSICSSLYYSIWDQSTVLCSLSCSKTPFQKISHEELNVSCPAKRSDLSVGLDGNRFTKLEIDEIGEMQIQYSAQVKTSPKLVPISKLSERGTGSLDEVALPYLFPSRYAPADRMRAIAMDLFGHIQGNFNIAMAIEDWLYGNIAYQVGVSGEQSWALDTMENRAGVCRDFAHLGIALCRALTVPARYCTVYSYQLQPQDFHAVFEVYIAGSWYVVDGTRMSPLNGMVRIATGRDASDAAVATLFGGVAGQGIAVDIQLANVQEEEFVPVTRDSLREAGKAFFLS